MPILKQTITGLGVSPGATVGLAAINDMFYEHERGQKTGLWVLALDSGLLAGPILGGFLNIVSAEWIQWFTALLFGLLLVLELAFMPETLYPRNQMLSRMPMATAGDNSVSDIEKIGRRRSDPGEVDLPRTKKLFFINFKPVPGMRHPKPWDSIVRVGLLFKFPIVPLAVGFYCYMWYWWMLAIITLIPAAYLYRPQIQGLLFIGLLFGTLFAEVFLGGRFSDWLVTKLAKKNNGVRVAEMRLYLTYPAAMLSAVGLIIWGVSIDKAYHWMVGQVAFFLFGAGVQMGNTVVCAYLVDAYPLQSMSVITFYSVFLNLSAFANPVSLAPLSLVVWLTRPSSSSHTGSWLRDGLGVSLPRALSLSLAPCRVLPSSRNLALQFVLGLASRAGSIQNSIPSYSQTLVLQTQDPRGINKHEFIKFGNLWTRPYSGSCKALRNLGKSFAEHTLFPSHGFLDSVRSASFGFNPFFLSLFLSAFWSTSLSSSLSNGPNSSIGACTSLSG